MQASDPHGVGQLRRPHLDSHRSSSEPPSSGRLPLVDAGLALQTWPQVGRLMGKRQPLPLCVLSQNPTSVFRKSDPESPAQNTSETRALGKGPGDLEIPKQEASGTDLGNSWET